MTKEKTKSIISIGFIDLLTGFLCSTAALMIIIKYGAEQAGDIAGGPKDYILYTGSVEFSNPQFNIYDIENSMIQLLVKKPDGSWIASEINEEGMILNEDGFVTFNDPAFYGMGPSLKIDENGRKLYYHIYGIAEIKPKQHWQIGMRYFSNRHLDKQLRNIDPTQLNNLLSAQLKVTHQIHHIAQKDTVSESKTELLSMGWDSFISVEIQDQ